MRAALVIDHRMDFIDDHCFGRLQQFAAALGRKQDEQRFGGCDQDVRRPLDHLLPFGHRRIAGPYGNTDRRQQQTFFPCQLRNFLKRPFEIFLDVVAERF